MKRFFVIASLVLCGFVSNAQLAAVDPHAGHNHDAVTKKDVTTNPEVPAAETLAIKETEFNFGKIPQGKPVTHIFEVSNTGKAPFKLDNVQASCGCTTPQWDKEKVIEPGASSVINVGYNAAAEGPFNKTITVTYNANQTKVIVIKGEVWKTPAASAPANTGLNDLKN